MFQISVSGSKQMQDADESKSLEHNTTFLLLFASGTLITIGTLCWFYYEEVSNFPTKHKWQLLISGFSVCIVVI